MDKDSQGFTNEERFLNSLARVSFLRFWSWPSLYRDQGDSNKGGDGKELCDLTVVFGDSVIFFSDKKIKFNLDKDEGVAWARWYRKAIVSSLDQINGALRWFEKYPDRVFTDKECNEVIPIDLNAHNAKKFYSVVVTHGIESEIKKYKREASFSFSSERLHTKTVPPLYEVGVIDSKIFTHVFNEFTIESVLSEFNTAKDFINYLNFREKILTINERFYVKSETDMIQVYFENISDDKLEKLDKTLSKLNGYAIDKGGLTQLHNNQYYISRKESDAVSYFWDHFIESFSHHVLEGTTERKNWEGPRHIEPYLRKMASADRFERRLLSNSFLDFYYKVLPGQRGTRVYFNQDKPELAYLFFALPYVDGESTNETYREVRLKMLEHYCLIKKLLHPNINELVGFAFKTRNSDRPLSSMFFQEGQDYCFYSVESFDDEARKHAEELYKTYSDKKMHSEIKYFKEYNSEFPELSNGEFTTRKRSHVSKGKDRNKRCKCGSGLKVKNCCKVY